MIPHSIPSRPLPTRAGLFGALGTLVPVVIASLSLLVVIWAAFWAVRSPYAGLDWSEARAGFVMRVDPLGPAFGVVSPSERILAINGDEAPTSWWPFGWLQVGDDVELTVAGVDGVVRTEHIVLTAPSSLPVILDRFLPLLVALAFWLSALIVVSLTQATDAGRRVGWLYFAMCNLTVWYVCSLWIGSVAGEPYIAIAFVCAYFLGVVTIHFHLIFPRPWLDHRWIRAILSAAYLVALVAAIDVIRQSVSGGSRAGHVDPNTLWLATCLSTVVLVLLIDLGLPADADSAFRNRVVALTALFGLLPALFLTLLPGIVASIGSVVSATVTFACVGIIPLGYTYGILRYRVIQLDGMVSRAIGYLIVILGITLALSLGAATLRASGVALAGPVFVPAMAVVAIGLALAFEPARRWVQGPIDRLFYRQWEDYRTALRSVDQVLAGTGAPEVAAWAESLCRQFAIALELKPVGLLLRWQTGRAYRLAVYDPTGLTPSLAIELEAASPLLAYLAARREPVTLRELRGALERREISIAERGWLASGVFELWWPIQTHSGLQAVLLFGPKPSGFVSEEVELVALTSHQIGVALENAQFAQELEQLSRAALRTRDEERKRVSRDLHDQIIQPLVSLNFALAAARDVPQAAEARLQVSELITHVRRISADLRPPALDEVGLPAAARGLTRTVARASGLQIEFEVRPDEDVVIPEPIASTFYSALRESLSNTQKHARATRVSVLLEALADTLVLVVHDDGVGFTPPSRLGKLAPSGHFGLLGLNERLGAIGGALSVQSEPGQGTRLECRAPLPPAV